MLRLRQEFSEDADLELSASRRDRFSRQEPNYGGRLDMREYQYDAEAVQRLRWHGGRMYTTIGAAYRRTAVESAQMYSAEHGQHNCIWRGFAHQSAKLTEILSLMGGVSVERSDTGGTEPAYQAEALVSPRRDHGFRLSYAEAPTIPTMFRKWADYRPGATVRLLGNPDLKAQRMRSYEAGYRGAWLGRKLRWETNFYYMDIEDRNQSYTQSAVFFPSPLITFSYDNGNRVLARGIESKLNYSWGSGRSVYLNYA